MRSLLFIFIGLSFFMIMPAFADNDFVDFQSAQLLIESGHPQASLDLLKRGHNSATASSQEWFLMAMAAKSSGLPREAISYLEKSIEIEPEKSGRAKLEISTLAYSIGDVEIAENYLMQVKDSRPPAKVGENVDQFLEIIKTKGAPKTWSLFTGIGWMYDSNANTGPAVDSVLMYGLPFILSKTAQENSDTAWMFNLGLNHNLGLTDNVAWQSAIQFNKTDYTTIDNLDSNVLSCSTGPSWRLTSKAVVSLPIVFDWVNVGHEQTYYSYDYGVAPQFRYSFTDVIALNVAASFSKKKYRFSSDRDSENYTLSPSLLCQCSSNSFFRVGVTAGRQDSGLSYQDNKLWGGNASYSHVFYKKLRVTLNAGYSDTDYSGKEVVYPETRRDKSYRYGADLSYRIKMIDADITAGVYWTRNDSNLIMYDYEREQTSVSLRKTF